VLCFINKKRGCHEKVTPSFFFNPIGLKKKEEHCVSFVLLFLGFPKFSKRENFQASEA
jgi:hypothetical protein